MDEGRAGKRGHPTRAAGRVRIRVGAIAALVLLSLIARGTPAGAAESRMRVPQYFPPLAQAPLDPPLRLSATFGEYRMGHFHAGLDFSTGETIGHPVYAALPGFVVRVRASGIGYGRSIYVQADDGRLLVYGHLDAYEEPLASYVDSAQSASGQYEQDLWPDPDPPGAPARSVGPGAPAGGRQRFRVLSGQRIGWSGRSGTDAPHLHFEIRRGDMAYNPLLAGLSVEDTIAPVIESVDFVANRPATSQSVARELVARVVDARSDGRRTMAPWSVSARSGDAFVEVRFDSVSWADDMPQVDYVYDRGRTPGQDRASIRLGAGAGFRPRVLRSSAPLRQVAGAFPVGRKIGVVARDAAGHETRRTIEVERGRRLPSERFPAPAHAGDWPFRWRLLGATRQGRAPGVCWSAAENPAFDTAWLEILRPEALARVGSGGADSLPSGLEPVSAVFPFVPPLLPLRVPLDISIESAAWADSQVGLYRESGEGWEWMGAARDSAHRAVIGSSRRLGRFALLRDVEAPRIDLAPPPDPRAWRAGAPVPPGAYPRWSLEARLDERGSGVAARASWFAVDGRRVPSEWDAVAETLRWRPLHPPARGTHEVEVVATDRAGNERRRRGSFVLD